MPSFDACACLAHCFATLLALFLYLVTIINKSHVSHDSVGCMGTDFGTWGRLRANDVYIKGCTSSTASLAKPPAPFRSAMASDPWGGLPPPPPPRACRPPPAAARRADPVPPDLSLAHLWQVRSGWDAKGPWETLDVVSARLLETQYQADNFEAEVMQSDNHTKYYYDLMAWEESRPHEVHGRPLRRVPWKERFNAAWSELGEGHALGGFCISDADMDGHSGGRPGSAADDHPMPDEEEEVWWQFRGGKMGNGKWRWADDSEWLEEAFQNRETTPVVQKTYDGETYEFDFNSMMQRSLTTPSAPARAIRRWMASLNLSTT